MYTETVWLLSYHVVLNCVSFSGYIIMARQRLRPWLLHTLDNEKIPGVDWVDRDEQIFRIPWKHGSKQDWTAQDSKIFLVSLHLFIFYF